MIINFITMVSVVSTKEENDEGCLPVMLTKFITS